MGLIHRLIRRGFDQARECVLTPGASTRAAAITEYVDFHLDGLHAHHSSEDELIWPVLHERASLSDSLIARMEEQHAGVHAAVEAARFELTAWAAAPTAARAGSLAAALGTITDRLAEHLAEEERDVVPLIAAHISQQEWDHLGKVAFSKFTLKQRFTAMGEMLEAARPAEAARMSAGLPAPVRVIWRLFGRRRYQRFMSSVRGTQAAG
jgi:hemerythrin-like domain-containing protein